MEAARRARAGRRLAFGPVRCTARLKACTGRTIDPGRNWSQSLNQSLRLVSHSLSVGALGVTKMLVSRRPSSRVVVQVVTRPAADIHSSFCPESCEKGGARARRNPFVLDGGRGFGDGLAVPCDDDASALPRWSRKCKPMALREAGWRLRRPRPLYASGLGGCQSSILWPSRS